MGFNGVVEIDKAIEFYLSMQRVFKLNALVPHLHNGTNDTLSLTIGLRSGNSSKALTNVVQCADLNECAVGCTSVLFAIVGVDVVNLVGALSQ